LGVLHNYAIALIRSQAALKKIPPATSHEQISSMTIMPCGIVLLFMFIVFLPPKMSDAGCLVRINMPSGIISRRNGYTGLRKEILKVLKIFGGELDEQK